MIGKGLKLASKTPAIVEAFRGYQEGRLELFLIVYHGNHRARIRLWGTGFQPTPWRCARCHKKVVHPDDLRYCLASKPRQRKAKQVESVIKGYLRILDDLKDRPGS